MQDKKATTKAPTKKTLKKRQVTQILVEPQAVPKIHPLPLSIMEALQKEQEAKELPHALYTPEEKQVYTHRRTPYTAEEIVRYWPIAVAMGVTTINAPSAERPDSLSIVQALPEEEQTRYFEFFLECKQHLGRYHEQKRLQEKQLLQLHMDEEKGSSPERQSIPHSVRNRPVLDPLATPKSQYPLIRRRTLSVDPEGPEISAVTIDIDKGSIWSNASSGVADGDPATPESPLPTLGGFFAQAGTPERESSLQSPLMSPSQRRAFAQSPPMSPLQPHLGRRQSLPPVFSQSPRRSVQLHTSSAEGSPSLPLLAQIPTSSAQGSPEIVLLPRPVVGPAILHQMRLPLAPLVKPAVVPQTPREESKTSNKRSCCCRWWPF